MEFTWVACQLLNVEIVIPLGLLGELPGNWGCGSSELIHLCKLVQSGGGRNFMDSSPCQAEFKDICDASLNGCLLPGARTILKPLTMGILLEGYLRSEASQSFGKLCC